MKHVLVDAREFVAGRRTGIGRFLEGLLLAIVDRHPEWQLTLALDKHSVLPLSLEGKVSLLYLPHFPELFWPSLSRGCHLFLSPYPKLPLRRLSCPTVHTIHDVFYLTHPAYCQHHLRKMAARWRLQSALKKASLTWFDSVVSRDACEELAHFNQEQAEVRYPAIEASFLPYKVEQQPQEPFFLYVGNGMPHKNVTLLLQAIATTQLQLKCVGIADHVGEALLKDCPTVSDQVTFLQAIDDEALLQLYRHATALLLPSTIEGYGYPPLEAMACATPAIVSDIEVLRETTGSVATYCPLHDVAAWRSTMVGMQTEQVRSAQVERGLSWVRCRQGKVGWQQHLDDLDHIIGMGNKHGLTRSRDG
ncbi:MAG: glycosyltransferase family 1 protein [Mariprofundaceae bacterium]